MSPILAFILGLLAGWLVEWVIDWVYWRRRDQARVEAETGLHQRVIALDQELLAMKNEAARLEPENARLKELAYRLEQELGELRARPFVPVLLVPDNLEEIDGIGPAIARKLNRAGVHTFEQLAAQSPEFLRQTLGSLVERLADEDNLLEQARQFAGQKGARASGEP